MTTPNSKDIAHTKVVHIGIGAFHRAHQAYYFDQLINHHTPWGIIGINLRTQDTATTTQLQQHNNTYDLQVISTDGQHHTQTITAIKHSIDYTHPFHAQEALDAVALKHIELITITVTESGYSLDENFNLNTYAKEIQDELTYGFPCTIYGFLRSALHLRMQRINQPITILCCDNLITNGNVLRQCFSQYLQLCNDTILMDWVAKNTTFPNCLVDRITPKVNPTSASPTPQNTIITEDFHQWIIEDNFISTRPPLEDTGVDFVKDAHPYERVKLSILNAGHSSICYFGVLAGYTYFHQALADEKLLSFYDKVQLNETIPAINVDLPLDIYAYQITTKKRLANAYLKDLLSRICLDGSNKIQLFILPTVLKCFDKGIIPLYNLRIIASWYVFMRKFLQKELTIDYQDFHWQTLKSLVVDGKEWEFATADFLWGNILVKYPIFSTMLHTQILQYLTKYYV